MTENNKINKLPAWHEVEANIRKEIKWLEKTIQASPYEKDFCSNCIYRQIAILILQGKIRAKDITSPNNSLWLKNDYKHAKQHGSEWHSKMMETITGHFKMLGYQVTQEPYLNKGRADLGVYKDDERQLFIEVGTVSLPKLLLNLRTLEGSDILLVLNDDHVIEFSIIERDIRHDLF